jgi:hypothetical protein
VENIDANVMIAEMTKRSGMLPLRPNRKVVEVEVLRRLLDHGEGVVSEEHRGRVLRPQE